MRWSHLALMAIAGLAISQAAVGRAEEATGSVRGTVTVAGHRLPSGKVFLHPDGGQAISSRVRDGDFSFEKVPAGTLRVSVAEEGLAQRYADPATSRLRVKVRGGFNVVRLDLVAEGIEVGRPAPLLPALGPDGNAVRSEDLRGKYLLLAFWRAGTKAPAAEEQFARLEEVRREFAGQENLLIISLCADIATAEDAAARWDQVVTRTVDYGRGKRRYIDDSRWWQCMDIGGPALPTTPRFGVGHKPEAFLIGPDGRFVAVRIPVQEMRREVAKAFGRAR